MKNLGILLATALVAGVAFGQTPAAKAPKLTPAQAEAQKKAADAWAKMTPEERKESMLRSTGGRIPKKGTMQGKIALVDVQGLSAPTNFQRLARKLLGLTNYNTVYVKGSEALAKASVLEIGPKALSESGANLVVVILANDALPSLLVAPEARWALVNVKALEKGLDKGKLYDMLFAARCRKEVMRAFSIVCGGSGSHYQGTVVNATCPEDLDKMDEAIPFDNIQAYRAILAKWGVTPREMVTYRQAYSQGWAPPPADDYQREVVKRVDAVRAREAAKKVGEKMTK